MLVLLLLMEIVSCEWRIAFHILDNEAERNSLPIQVLASPIETDTLLYLLHHNERLKMMRAEPNNAEDNDEQLVVQFFCVERILLVVSRRGIAVV